VDRRRLDRVASRDRVIGVNARLPILLGRHDASVAVPGSAAKATDGASHR